MTRRRPIVARRQPRREAKEDRRRERGTAEQPQGSQGDSSSVIMECGVISKCSLCVEVGTRSEDSRGEAGTGEDDSSPTLYCCTAVPHCTAVQLYSESSVLSVLPWSLCERTTKADWLNSGYRLSSCCRTVQRDTAHRRHSASSSIRTATWAATVRGLSSVLTIGRPHARWHHCRASTLSSVDIRAATTASRRAWIRGRLHLCTPSALPPPLRTMAARALLKRKRPVQVAPPVNLVKRRSVRDIAPPAADASAPIAVPPSPSRAVVSRTAEEREERRVRRRERKAAWKANLRSDKEAAHTAAPAATTITRPKKRRRQPSMREKRAKRTAARRTRMRPAMGRRRRWRHSPLRKPLLLPPTLPS